MSEIELSTKPLPNRIRELRKLRGLTIDELAQATTASGQQLHKSTLSKLESGERRLTVRMAEAIAAVLNVPVGELSAPSERPLVLMVPVIGWTDLADAFTGKEFSGKPVVPVIAPQSSRLVAMEVSEEDVSAYWRAQLCLDGIAIIRLGDDEKDVEGVYVGAWSRYSGFILHDGSRYKDCSHKHSDETPTPYIEPDVRVHGRVIQCIVEPRLPIKD